MTATSTNKALKRAEGQRDRLLEANRRQARDILALVVALREVHAMLADESHAPPERIATARRHIAAVVIARGNSLGSDVRRRPPDAAPAPVETAPKPRPPVPAMAEL